MQLGGLLDACTEARRLAGVDALGFAVREVLHARLVLLDQLVELVSLLHARVLVFLLPLANNASRLHNVVVDVPLNRLAHLIYRSLSLLLRCALHFFAGLLFVTKPVPVVFVERVALNVSSLEIGEPDLFWLDKVFHAFGKLAGSLVSFGAVYKLV